MSVIGVKIIPVLNDEVYKMYKDVAKQEVHRTKYLFEKDSVIGLNANLLTKYMRYLTEKY